jgi:hypothetical protein
LISPIQLILPRLMVIIFLSRLEKLNKILLIFIFFPYIHQFFFISKKIQDPAEYKRRVRLQAKQYPALV